MDFIKQAYTAENENFLETFVDRVSTEHEGASGTSSNTNTAGECSRPVNAKEKEIQNVLDVLPDLKKEFVSQLLDRYENTEQAIAAILEGNLPPDLNETVVVEDQNPSNDNKSDVTIAMESLNIAENTEITSKHIKSMAIRPKAEKRFLDDKSQIKEFHERNSLYGYIDENEYDDEYDDSYEALTESESKQVGKRILKNTGAINEIVDEVEDSDSSEEEINESVAEGGQQRDRTRDFCENPEAIRERWARNREAKYASSNKRPARPQA